MPRSSDPTEAASQRREREYRMVDPLATVSIIVGMVAFAQTVYSQGDTVEKSLFSFITLTAVGATMLLAIVTTFGESPSIQTPIVWVYMTACMLVGIALTTVMATVVYMTFIPAVSFPFWVITSVFAGMAVIASVSLWFVFFGERRSNIKSRRGYWVIRIVPQLLVFAVVGAIVCIFVGRANVGFWGLAGVCVNDTCSFSALPCAEDIRSGTLCSGANEFCVSYDHVFICLVSDEPAWLFDGDVPESGDPLEACDVGILNGERCTAGSTCWTNTTAFYCTPSGPQQYLLAETSDGGVSRTPCPFVSGSRECAGDSVGMFCSHSVTGAVYVCSATSV